MLANNSCNRVGVVLKSYLGDAVMATPLLRCLVQPNFEPVVFVGGPAYDLLNNRIDCQVQKLKFVCGKSRLLDQVSMLRKSHLDAVVLVNRSFRSALVARAAGIKQRIGHSTESRGVLLTQKFRYSKDDPEFISYLDLLSGISPTSRDIYPEIDTGNIPCSCGRPSNNGGTVAIQAGARYESKQIPLDVLAEVGRQLISEGQEIVLVGGKEEIGQASNLETKIGAKVHNLVGKTEISELIHVLLNCKLVIGSDTGLMHIAAAVGTKTITVFGPNSSLKWGHNYFPHIVLNAREGRMENVNAEMILTALRTSDISHKLPKIRSECL